MRLGTAVHAKTGAVLSQYAINEYCGATESCRGVRTRVGVVYMRAVIERSLSVRLRV